jgi:hypothetical protein
MTKQNAWNRRKGRNGQRKQRRIDRNKAHLINCQSLCRKKRREARANVN